VRYRRHVRAPSPGDESRLSLQNASFTPDGRQLLALKADWAVVTVDVVTGTQTASFSTIGARQSRLPGGDVNLCLSPDGTKLAITSASSLGVDFCIAGRAASSTRCPTKKVRSGGWRGARTANAWRSPVPTVTSPSGISRRSNASWRSWDWRLESHLSPAHPLAGRDSFRGRAALPRGRRSGTSALTMEWFTAWSVGWTTRAPHPPCGHPLPSDGRGLG